MSYLATGIVLSGLGLIIAGLAVAVDGLRRRVAALEARSPDPDPVAGPLDDILTSGEPP